MSSWSSGGACAAGAPRALSYQLQLSSSEVPDTSLSASAPVFLESVSSSSSGSLEGEPDGADEHAFPRTVLAQ